MHVITRRRLQEFWEQYPDAEPPLRTWLAMMRQKRYGGSHDVRQDFASASFLGRWRTVFNIGGNKYRLITDMRYDLGRVYIRAMLTHQEYTRRTREGTL
jgi:mRNA interferase HigB